MAIKYSTSIIVVDSDPNSIAEIQGDQNQLVAMHEDGTQFWDFVAANLAGAKWVERVAATDIELFS